MKEILQGFRFAFRVEGVTVQVFTPEFKIIKEHKSLPNIDI